MSCLAQLVSPVIVEIRSASSLFLDLRIWALKSCSLLCCLILSWQSHYLWDPQASIMRKCLWVCGDVCMWQSQIDNTLHQDRKPRGKKAASLVSSLDWCPYSHYAIILHLFAQQIICHSQLSYLLVLFWLLQLPHAIIKTPGQRKSEVCGWDGRMFDAFPERRVHLNLTSKDKWELVVF